MDASVFVSDRMRWQWLAAVTAAGLCCRQLQRVSTLSSWVNAQQRSIHETPAQSCTLIGENVEDGQVVNALTVECVQHFDFISQDLPGALI